MGESGCEGRQVRSQGGGGTLIFSYIHRLGSFLGVQNFEFKYCGYFWGSSQNWTVFRGHFYAF